MQVISDLYQSAPLGVYLQRLSSGLLRCQFVDLGQSVSSHGLLSHSEWFS